MYRKTPITEAINNPKINQQSKDAFIKFADYACNLYGIPKLSNDESKRILFDFMVQNFGALTFEEVQLALNMNLNSQFKHTIDAFNKLSAPFLAKVVEQYRPIRQHELKYNRLPDAAPRVVSDAEKVYSEFLESCVKLKEVLAFNDWRLIYKHMEDIGEAPTESEMIKLMAVERSEVIKDYNVEGDRASELTLARCKRIFCQKHAQEKTGVKATPEIFQGHMT